MGDEEREKDPYWQLSVDRGKYGCDNRTDSGLRDFINYLLGYMTAHKKLERAKELKEEHSISSLIEEAWKSHRLVWIIALVVIKRLIVLALTIPAMIINIGVRTGNYFWVGTQAEAFIQNHYLLHDVALNDSMLTLAAVVTILVLITAPLSIISGCVTLKLRSGDDIGFAMRSTREVIEHGRG